jgi:hypothetical protein
MLSLRAIATPSFAAALLFSGLALNAQTASTPTSIDQKLESDYALTKITADRSDIVTAGSVLVLKKDGLIMIASTSTRPTENTYKDGKISQGLWKMARVGGLNGLTHPVGTAPIQSRRFVTGEKFWVTKISVQDDGVILELFSDPISGTRYYSTLKLPFPKGSFPPVDEVEKNVAEVMNIQRDDAPGTGDAAGDGGKRQSQTLPPGTAAAVPPPAMAPIAPPPPPADTPPPAPKTIALKQTRDEVVANFGAPTKIVKLGVKEIDYYPDMKVTFVNNKVADVQ